MTEGETQALEEAFRNSYNSLTFLGCDGYFRAIVDVKLVIGSIGQTYSSNRRLQQDFINGTTNGTWMNTTSNFTNFTNFNASSQATFGPAIFSVQGQWYVSAPCAW